MPIHDNGEPSFRKAPRWVGFLLPAMGYHAKCGSATTTTTTKVLIIVTLHKVAGALYISDLKNDGSSQKSVVRQLKQMALCLPSKRQQRRGGPDLCWHCSTPAPLPPERWQRRQQNRKFVSRALSAPSLWLCSTATVGHHTRFRGFTLNGAGTDHAYIEDVWNCSARPNKSCRR